MEMCCRYRGEPANILPLVDLGIIYDPVITVIGKSRFLATLWSDNSWFLTLFRKVQSKQPQAGSYEIARTRVSCLATGDSYIALVRMPIV